MNDRLADQHVRKDVRPQRAGEELAPVPADRAAGLGRNREIRAADRDPAIGEILPDLIGDIEMGAKAEGPGRRSRGSGGERRAGQKQKPLPHESLSPRHDSRGIGDRPTRVNRGRLPPYRTHAARRAPQRAAEGPRRYWS